jgi:uncharacterized coiled-coil DUF342 family protein
MEPETTYESSEVRCPYWHDSLAEHDPLPWPDFARKLKRERDHANLQVADIRKNAGDLIASLAKKWDDAERERDEARERVRELQKWTTVNGVTEMERELRGLRAERDEASEENSRLTTMAMDFREQRDTLAEALKTADECLALFEDTAHGELGEMTTKTRKIIAALKL